jgi:hypothetical protein
MSDDGLLNPMCPDVLGSITRGPRTHMDTLQFAVGVFPPRAYLHQPFEVIVILQNMVDHGLDVKVALQLPTRDANGQPINLSTPKKMVGLTMKPGEVGVLRLPIVALPPTEPANDLPLRVAVRHRVGRGAKPLRPPAGGAPPSALAVSPFKLQALQEVQFVEQSYPQSPENVTAYFSLDGREVPPASQPPKASYEVLWTLTQFKQEKTLVLSKIDDARIVASGMTRQQIYQPLLHTVDEYYALRGLPLHPGEAKAIAKMITYTLDDGATLEQLSKLEDLRWFQTLCQVLAHDPSVATWEAGPIASQYLFEAALYDSVLLGFKLIRPRVRVNLGDRAEREGYANRLLSWLAGETEPDLTYIYLPLVLGGVTVNAIVTGRDEDPWLLLDELREAYRGRMRLVSGSAIEVFDMLDKLLVRAEDDLRRARILRG